MEWTQLLSQKRQRVSTTEGKYKSADLRSEYEKDYHRIIGSASFRRLQDKTQVFPLDKSDFIRTRLTHSLEVSSIARSLGQNIGESIIAQHLDTTFNIQMKEAVCNVLQCAGLLHDIGNPPFGHFGEEAIRNWFRLNLPKMQINGRTIHDILSPQMREDFYHFEGNAQALRLVTKLHYLVDDYGMNLTYALLSTIIKYPGSSTEIDVGAEDIKYKKMGYYYADTAVFESIQSTTGTCGMRNPLTFILEAADDIAYKTADIEDAYIKGFLSYQDLYYALEKLNQGKEVLGQDKFNPLSILKQQYLRGVEKQVVNAESYAIKNWIVRMQGYAVNCVTKAFVQNYHEIMEGRYKKDLFWNTEMQCVMETLGKLACDKVFFSEEIYKLEMKESIILNYLMDLFMHAVLKYDTDEMSAMERRVFSLISENYINTYKIQSKEKPETEKLYLRLLLVTDYICGMTDSYALRLYQEIKGITRFRD